MNDLPDPNYATLKFFLGHLYRYVHLKTESPRDYLTAYISINQHADENSMSMQNLAIVFGPTLFGQAPANGQQAGVMADASFQNMVSKL